MAKTAGFAICDLNTGETYDTFTAKDFSDDWKLKRELIICHPQNVTHIQDIFK